MITLNKIIKDIQLIIEGSEINQSEPITEAQIEEWVHQYRALLLKRELNKGRKIAPEFEQELVGLALEYVDATSDYSHITSDYTVIRTVRDIPDFILTNDGPAVSFVGNNEGIQIDFVSEIQLAYKQYKKFSHSRIAAYLKKSVEGQKLYIVNDKEIGFITIRGVFSNPVEAANMQKTIASSAQYTPITDAYPIPLELIPPLREMILKNELKIEVAAPSDETNNSQDDA